MKTTLRNIGNYEREFHRTGIRWTQRNKHTYIPRIGADDGKGRIVMKEVLEKIKDPGSAITHFIAMMMAAFSALPLLIHAMHSPKSVNVGALAVFIISMILLYAASTMYHTFDRGEKINRMLKKLDHSMISVLIAGTYTPVCLIVLKPSQGIPMLLLIWSLAAAGILIKLFWVYCPRWFSSVIYIIMGWTCVLAFGPLLNTLSAAAFGWLLAGGIIYTIGAVVYALKLPLFNSRHKYFGTHEIFHLFVMGGSICHFVFMYCYVC